MIKHSAHFSGGLSAAFYLCVELISAAGLVGKWVPSCLPQMRHENSLCDQEQTVAFGGDVTK